MISLLSDVFCDSTLEDSQPEPLQSSNKEKIAIIIKLLNIFAKFSILNVGEDLTTLVKYLSDKLEMKKEQKQIKTKRKKSKTCTKYLAISKKFVKQKAQNRLINDFIA